MAVDRQVDPRLERRRRRLLARVVPRLLSRHLETPLGWRRFPFLARLLVIAPHYQRLFGRADDDAGLRQVKQTFAPVGALYHRLAPVSGAAAAEAIAAAFLHDLANAVQRDAYLPAHGAEGSWEAFHRAHEAQMAAGFIRHNDNSGIRTSADAYRFEIVRCRFHDAFRDMGAPGLTEAFCRSDEVVFNAVLPTQMRFHRGTGARNTIARGGAACVFVFERLATATGRSRP